MAASPSASGAQRGGDERIRSAAHGEPGNLAQNRPPVNPAPPMRRAQADSIILRYHRLPLLGDLHSSLAVTFCQNDSVAPGLSYASKPRSCGRVNTHRHRDARRRAGPCAHPAHRVGNGRGVLALLDRDTARSSVTHPLALVCCAVFRIPVVHKRSLSSVSSRVGWGRISTQVAE